MVQLRSTLPVGTFVLGATHSNGTTGVVAAVVPDYAPSPGTLGCIPEIVSFSDERPPTGEFPRLLTSDKQNKMQKKWTRRPTMLRCKLTTRLNLNGSMLQEYNSDAACMY